MAASGNLKMPGSPSVSDESVVSRRKNGKFISRKQKEKCSRGTMLAEEGRKRVLEEREEGEVGSPASRRARLRSVGHILVRRTFKWKVLSIWIC